MWPSTSTTPSDGREDPGEHLEQRALAGAVGPDDAERLAVDHVNETSRSAQKSGSPVALARAGSSESRTVCFRVSRRL